MPLYPLSAFFFRPSMRHIDCQGVLYHAEYFGFADEARTHWLRSLGYPPDLWKEDGVMFVVRKCQARYLHPICFDDEMIIETQIKEVTCLSVTVLQIFIRDLITTQLETQLVCLDMQKKLCAFPERLNTKFIEFHKDSLRNE